jgi:hypothetical protein
MSEYKRHDIHTRTGFFVDPEQLAHDLTILKLKDNPLLKDANEFTYYDTYIQQLSYFRTIIADKTKYDSTINN